MSELKHAKVIYNSQRQIDEMTQRSYASHLIVETPDGRKFPLFVIEPLRIKQETEITFASGEAVYFETGMVIVPEVTEEGVAAAVEELYLQGYFNSLLPLTDEQAICRSKGL